MFSSSKLWVEKSEIILLKMDIIFNPPSRVFQTHLKGFPSTWIPNLDSHRIPSALEVLRPGHEAGVTASQSWQWRPPMEWGVFPKLIWAMVKTCYYEPLSGVGLGWPWSFGHDIYVNRYICIRVYTIYIYRYICIFVFKKEIYIYMWVYLNLCILFYICIHIYIYAYIYMYIYM